MKKRGKQVNIKINFTNRWLYSLIALGILIVVGVGVYASTYINSATKTGHDLNELQPCAAGQILQTSGGSWNCVTLPTCAGGQFLQWTGSAWLCLSAFPTGITVYSHGNLNGNCQMTRPAGWGDSQCANDNLAHCSCSTSGSASMPVCGSYNECRCPYGKMTTPIVTGINPAAGSYTVGYGDKANTYTLVTTYYSCMD